MARVLTNEKNYYDIADTIRQMKDVSTTYKPREMASALKDIYSNEVEGTLPLTFQANGSNLLNYRIDGASGGVGERTNNLFDLKKAVKKKYINSNGAEATSLAQVPGNALNHSDYVSIESNVNYTFTCNTSQNYSLENTIALCWFDENKNILSRNTMNVRGNINNYSITALSPSTAKYLIVNFIAYVDDAVFYLNEGTTTVFEPYGYKVPVVISGKNLFDENAITNEILRDNDGTTNSNNNWRCSNFINIPQNNNNILISWESDSAYFQAKIAFYDNQKNFISLSNYGINNTYLITFNLPNNCEFIRFSYSQTVNNVPANRHNIQIILGSTPTNYEPYHEPTTTNIYLDEPINQNESISLSETNVDIPTIEGTNVLTIDTTVQPSNVYVQARKDTHEMYEIKSLLQPSLNKFGANISTLNPIIDYSNVINEIYDKLPKVTQSGAGFTLLDVQNGQVDDFKMNGVDLSQSGTPTPDNPQEIKVVEGRQVITVEGKNKFYLNNNYSANYDEASIEINNNNSFILRMNKTLSNTQSPCATIEFNASYLKTNTTYTISKKNSNTGYVLNHVGSIRLYINGSYGNFIDADEYTFTTPNAITSFKILLYLFFENSTTGNYEITFYDVQLEEGPTATDYEPYHEAVDYNIDLSLENIQLAKMPNTTYKNRIYKNNGNWYFEENVKKIVLDGSEDENWTIYLNTKNYVNIWQGTPQIMCNYFKPTTNNSWISNDDSYRGMCSSLNTAGIFKCMTLTNMTIAEFKTWLSTHNVIVWYELQNPVTTQITNTTLINQLETISVHTGTNIITISNDNNIIPEIEITRLKELEKLV